MVGTCGGGGVSGGYICVGGKWWVYICGGERVSGGYMWGRG